MSMKKLKILIILSLPFLKENSIIILMLTAINLNKRVIFLNQEMLKSKPTITMEPNLKIDTNGQPRNLMMIMKKLRLKRNRKMGSQDFKGLIFVSLKIKNLVHQKK
jgi:hypothetical protein